MLLPWLAKLNKFISTFFYVGFLRPAPGTWGSIAGIVLAYIILITMGLLTFFIILLCLNIFLGKSPVPNNAYILPFNLVKCSNSMNLQGPFAGGLLQPSERLRR